MRYFHPLEVLSVQGFRSQTAVAVSLLKGHKQVGNNLSLGYALLGLAKVHEVLKSASPFQPLEALSELALKIEENKMHLARSKVVFDGKFQFAKLYEPIIEAPYKKIRIGEPPVVSSTEPCISWSLNPLR